MKLDMTANMKRKICLNDVKMTFQQSGYVDWHFNPSLHDQSDEHPDSDLAGISVGENAGIPEV